MEISAIHATVPLDELAGNPRLSEPEKIAEATRQFEAVLLRQILTEAQKPTFKSKYNEESTATGIYRDMSVEQIADAISRSGHLGLGQALRGQLQQQLDVK